MLVLKSLIGNNQHKKILHIIDDIKKLDSNDAILKTFLEGYCYDFAHILSRNTVQSEIVFLTKRKHYVLRCAGRFYDPLSFLNGIENMKMSTLVKQKRNEIKHVLDEHRLENPKILGTSDILDHEGDPWIDLVVYFKEEATLYSLTPVEKELTNMLNVTVHLTHMRNLSPLDKEIIERDLVDI